MTKIKKLAKAFKRAVLEHRVRQLRRKIIFSSIMLDEFERRLKPYILEDEAKDMASRLYHKCKYRQQQREALRKAALN